MSREKTITKKACAHLLLSAEKAHQRTNLINGALGVAVIFATIFSQIFGIAIAVILLAYNVFMWKRQDLKVKYLIQKYVSGVNQPFGGI